MWCEGFAEFCVNTWDRFGGREFDFSPLKKGYFAGMWCEGFAEFCVNTWDRFGVLYPGTLLGCKP